MPIKRIGLNLIPWVNRPYVALIDITKRCNLKCTYCFGKENRDDSDLPASTLIRMMAQLSDMGVRHLGISGGEALLHSEIRQILAAAYRYNFSVGLNSNGILVPKYIESLRHLDHITISLDSLSQKQHDRYRGKGAHAKAMEAIEIVHRERIPLHLAMTLNGQDIGEIKQVLTFAAVRKAQVLISPLYETISSPKKSSMDGEEVGRLRSTLNHILLLKQAGYPVYFSRMTYNAIINWPFGSQNASSRLLPGHPRCLLGKKLIFIDNKGLMYPCPVLAQESMGINCIDLGVKTSFFRLKQNACRTCRWACFIENNYLLNWSPPVVWSQIRQKWRQRNQLKTHD